MIATLIDFRYIANRHFNEDKNDSLNQLLRITTNYRYTCNFQFN